MDFDFPDELKQLRETAREFLRERCRTSVARRVLESGEQLDRPLWQEMANMGWTGASIPEEYGGAGLGRLAVCVLAEEVGRAIAPVPFSSSVYLATEALLLFGSPAQKQHYLTRLGERRRDRHFCLYGAAWRGRSDAARHRGDRRQAERREGAGGGR